MGWGGEVVTASVSRAQQLVRQGACIVGFKAGVLENDHLMYYTRKINDIPTYVCETWTTSAKGWYVIPGTGVHTKTMGNQVCCIFRTVVPPP